MHKRIHCRKIRNGDYTKKETKSIIITIKKKKKPKWLHYCSK